MTAFRNRLTRRAAERILDHRGDPTEPVARLVDAAASAAPVAGEDQAAALFRAATESAPVAAAGTSARAATRPTGRLAALPVAALAAGVLALGGGGLALAATQGAVNVPFTGHDHRSDRAPAAPATSNPGLSHPSGAPSGEGTPDAQHLPSASPSPSLEGLCRAFQAGAVPKKASNPAFAALRTAAGGAESVPTYCAELIGTPTRPSHPTPARPTPSHASPSHPSPRHPSPAQPSPSHAGPSHPSPAPPSPPRPTEATHEKS